MSVVAGAEGWRGHTALELLSSRKLGQAPVEGAEGEVAGFSGKFKHEAIGEAEGWF